MATLGNLVNAAGPTQQIAQTVTWVRRHFAEEIRVGQLPVPSSRSGRGRNMSSQGTAAAALAC
jgi:hypothetical protein